MAEDKEKKAYEDRIAELEAQLSAKTESEQTLLNSNAELQQRLQSTEEDLDRVKVIVTHDKKKYEVLTPKFSYQGQAYEAKDLKNNKEVVAELIEKKSGILRAL